MGSESAWRREIVELHDFFQRWLRGEASPGELERLESALADGFTMIVPSGELVRRDELVPGIWERRGAVPSLRIAVEEPTLRDRGEAWVLATYQEWQKTTDRETGRLSTVVFRQAPGAPNGLEWVHVHESWIPGAGPS